MKRMTAKTYVITLYLSGPIEVAKQVLREECLREGLCVTIEPTHFVYTGGEEIGYRIGLLNYPRFPAENEALFDRAIALLEMLIERTAQHSGLLVDDANSIWLTKREAT